MSTDWQQELLAGVEIIPNTGAVPGTLTILNNNTCRPISPGPDIWIAASEYGHGRVLVVAHESYLAQFNTSHNQNKHIAQFQLNIKHWLTRGRYTTDNGIGILGHISKSSIPQYQILIWNGADNCHDITSNDLVQFVGNGGAVVHCMCSWGWLQLKPGKSLNDIPYKNFMDTIGISYNNAASFLPDGGLPVGHLVPQNIQYRTINTTPSQPISHLKLTDPIGEQWRHEILQDVHRIPHTGAVPGSLVVFGDLARPILSSVKNIDIWIAGAELGNGRVLVMAHEGYYKNKTDVNLKTLHENLKRWLTKHRFGNNPAIVPVDQRTKLAVGMILVWSGECNSKYTTEEVVNFVASGGAFIHTMCPWGWLSGHPGKTFDDMPLSGVLDVIGVSYTSRYVNIPAEGLVVSDCKSDELCHLGKVVDVVTQDRKVLAQVGDVVEMISELSNTKVSCFSKQLESLSTVVESSNDFVPSECHPVKSKESKALMSICEALYNSGKLKHKLPGIINFPGEFSVPPLKTSVQLQVTSHIQDVHPTGYYVASGESISITILSPSEQDWSIQIGAHSDCLTGQIELKRWPKVVCSQGLHQPVTVIHSAFGGLVYLLSPKGRSNITLQLDNVIEAPFFDATVPITNTTWHKRRNAPGLWADICGEFLIITLPSDSIRNLGNPSEVMQIWDNVLKAHFHLKGVDIRNHRRQWLVTDVQPSVGYMHSGYPVVTHMDVADPQHEFHLLNKESLLTKGSWGVFHEFGHNMQDSTWTFDGTTEVTVNIFTLHAMEVVTGQKPWIHSWLQNQIPNTKQYLNSNESYSKWKTDPGIALFIYAQIAHHLGWPLYKEVFRKYERLDPSRRPSHEQDQIDTWYIFLSDVSQMNLEPLLDFWKIPVSQNARQTMRRYPPYLPDDEIIQSAPAQLQRTLSMHPNCIRRPMLILPDTSYSTAIGPAVTQSPRLNVLSF